MGFWMLLSTLFEVATIGITLVLFRCRNNPKVISPTTRNILRMDNLLSVMAMQIPERNRSLF